jgi:mono/diheme cytochrome c family protein
MNMNSSVKTLLVAGLILSSASFLSAADVTENWNKNCASCHGKDGVGNTTMGKKKGAKDYTDAAVQAKFSDAEATKAIKSGVPDKMKAYGDKFSEDEIKALVAYVRAFKK